MASLIINDSVVYVHFPRTGGHWLRWVLEQRRIPFVEHRVDGSEHSPHTRDHVERGLKIFSLTRDVEGWAWSWYMFHDRTGYRYFPTRCMTRHSFVDACRVHRLRYADYRQQLHTEGVTLYDYSRIYEFLRNELFIELSPEEIATRIN